MYIGPVQKLAGKLHPSGEFDPKPVTGRAVPEQIGVIYNEFGDVVVEPRPDVLEFPSDALLDCPDASLETWKESRSVVVKRGARTPERFGLRRHEILSEVIPPEGKRVHPERALWLLNKYPMLLQEQDEDNPAFPNGYDPEADEAEEVPEPKPEKPKRKPRARKPATADAPTKKPRRKRAAKAAEETPAADKE